MFRSASPDLADDPEVQRFLQFLATQRFGPEGPGPDVDFATLEQWAHDTGRAVARRLCEQGARQQARDPEQPRPCPDCGQTCAGTVDTRDLLTRDGPIALEEIRHDCPHCRRAFFPLATDPTLDPPLLQPGHLDRRHRRRYSGPFLRRSRQAAGDHR